jgi:hypothetical protein
MSQRYPCRNEGATYCEYDSETSMYCIRRRKRLSNGYQRRGSPDQYPETYQVDIVAEGGDRGNLRKDGYYTLERLYDLIVSSEFSEGPCLLLENGGN